MIMGFRLLTIPFVFLLLISQIYQATGHRLHSPSYVFDDHISGKKALNPARVTNASAAHLEGVKGRTKTGHRVSVAVIDLSINSTLPHMQDLKNKGLIHPAALEPDNLYMINADENFDKYKLTIQHLEETIRRLDAEHSALRLKEYGWPIPSPEERERIRQQQQIINQERQANEEQLKDYKKKDDFLQSRKRFLEGFNEWGACNHGSGVIHALHKIAPEACILPIDIIADHGKTTFEAMTDAIRAATRHNVDCINLSLKFTYLDEEGLEALAEAVRQGILIVTSAGNDGYPGVMSYMRTYDINKQKLFERLGRQGIIFAGSTSIDSSGKEEVSSYCQHPDEDTKRNFIVTPGEDQNIQANKNPYELVRGTSFSAPVVSGAFLGLKQYCLDKNYNVTTENLRNFLYDSGHDITYWKPWPSTKITYKSVDAWKACQYAEEIFNPQPKPVPPPAPTVTKKGKIEKPIITKRVTRKARVRSTPNRTTRKRAVVKSPKRKRIAKKAAIRPKVKRSGRKKTTVRKRAVVVKKTAVKSKKRRSGRGKHS